MAFTNPYIDLASQNVRPTIASDVGKGQYDVWDCLIDEQFVHVALQKENEKNMRKGYTAQWRITIYQSEAQGVEKFFNNEQDALATYNALVADKVPSPRTLVNVWDFEWNF